MDRMGGVLVVAESTKFSFTLTTDRVWHCDLEHFVEEYNSTDLYKINYTLGHKGEDRHEWLPIGYEVYQGSEKSDCDYVCVIKYEPRDISFIKRYAYSKQANFGGISR